MGSARSRLRSRKGLGTGMTRRQGFTLIELLIVVVIIGILAAIAIPKFANTKGKAVVASMKSDLRNLASAQEGYWVEYRTYYGGAIPNAAFNYQPTEGVTVTMVSANDAGWSASASATTTPQTCVIFYGTAPRFLRPRTMVQWPAASREPPVADRASYRGTIARWRRTCLASSARQCSGGARQYRSGPLSSAERSASTRQTRHLRRSVDRTAWTRDRVQSP